ncbi:MAG TPA: hypothetical protein VF331_20685 [Polyangiales bacterium]
MTMTPEPRRWVDEDPNTLPDEFAAGMRGYRELGPDAEQSLRMWQQLARTVEPASSESLQPSAAASGVSLAKRMSWGLLLTAVAIAGWWYATPVAAPVAVPGAGPSHAMPVAPLRAVPVPPAARATGAPSTPPSAHVDAEASQPASEPVPPGKSQRDPRFAGRAAHPPSTTTPVASDPAAEVALLTRARRVLYSVPARALELTEEHARTYPHGTFAEERELIAIDALINVGRTAEATKRGRAFLQMYPHSAGVDRVKALVGVP